MQQNRRRFLHLSGAAALAAIAGCSSTGGNGNGNGNGNSNGDTTTTTDSGNGNGNGNGDGTASFDGWLDGTDNFDGTVVDATGESQVTIDVGASANGGSFGFAPPVVTVDPGTTVVWEWTGDGGVHNVVGENMDFRSGDPTGDAGNTFEQTFEDDATVKYYCNPHRQSGMKGVVVVGEGSEADDTDDGDTSDYGWEDATWDSYWYSLYNMSTNIAMSGNGVPFPLNEQMEELQSQRMPAMLEAADTDRPPINQPNLTFAAFTEGDPSFTQQPVLEDDTGRPDGTTLAWDKSNSSGVVSPSSLAWTHLKGVTWAKNFETHFETLPAEIAAKFRAQLLTTLAQVGINAAILVGGSRGNGALTHGDSFEFLSEYRPAEGQIEDETRRPHHHAAMVWFLSDITSLAQNGWFGYVNPRPLIPKEAGADGVFDMDIGIQEIADGVAEATMNFFTPAEIVEMESTRSVGLMLAAIGYYGTQAGSEEATESAADYANALADELATHVEGDGRVADGAANQAATQGIVGQGLLWAGQLDGVDREPLASDVLGYMIDELWDEQAGTFATGTDDDVYTITARDAGDVTGGINAADAVLDMDVRDIYARYFNQTFNRGRLQRAERPQSRDESAEYTLPLPPAAGGEHGQAAVYNAEIEYDTTADEWSVTDDSFDTEGALYLANQDIWIGQWAGDFYQGRGVPGESDTPPN
ncbi:halocyanin domain-containing protein [Halapricum salinum]|uniref:Halocyanin domain-containing protein n=1 Tax=Halapricum salinum TaxID=1457250 RepID=A0A4D6HCF4_9EURY|nr:halocyanin domain-containing protein [Halapricum salinum]QCC51669.1 halocyanin domain-containing protein [Halapricum salinum]